MKILGIETNKAKRTAAKKAKKEKRAAKEPRDVFTKSAVGEVGPSSVSPPIHPTPPAPAYQGKQLIGQAGGLHKEQPFRLDVKNLDLPVLDFSRGTKPNGRIAVLLGLRDDDEELTTTLINKQTSRPNLHKCQPIRHITVTADRHRLFQNFRPAPE
jgi:hypothetical protein